MLTRANSQPDHPRPRLVSGFEDISSNWDNTQGCWMAKILPGEFYITGETEAITTVLGSCISACIRDPALQIGGMNHFMLPEDTTQGKSAWLDGNAGLATRYGSFAMESLINGLLKLGAKRQRLEVKLFGGGHVLQAAIAVGERNIKFARDWLRTEGLPIVAEDVGSDVPRRIIYLPASGKVRVKHLRSAESGVIARREQQHLQTFVQKPVVSDIELF